QHCAVLRRGCVHRHRFHSADQGLHGRKRRACAALRAFRVGDSHRAPRIRDPRRAVAAVRPPTEAEARAMITLEWGYLLAGGLFAPALIVPAVALFGTLLLKNAQIGGTPLLDAKQVTLISLAAGAMLALAAAMLWLKPQPLVPLHEGRRLIDTIGWAAILPQL